MINLKDKRVEDCENPNYFWESDVEEAVNDLNSIKLGWSDIRLGFEYCDCESHLRVVEFKGMKFMRCYDCLKKEIFGDWEND